MLVEVQGTKPQRREAIYTGKPIKKGYTVPYVRAELEGFKAPLRQTVGGVKREETGQDEPLGGH